MQIIIALILNALALVITTYIVPGVKVADFTTAILAGIVLGLVNTFIKPILTLVTLPITVVTLGLFAFVINAAMLLLAAAVVPGFMVDGWMAAVLGSIVLSIASTALSMLVKDVTKK